jgi:hypothetical protein
MRTITGNASLVNDHTGLSGSGRYVRMNGTLRGTAWGYSIFEFEVYGTPGSCTLPAQPGTITGNTSVASGSGNTYSVAAVGGATSYTWTLPSGWSGSSTTTSIATTAGSAGGTISVSANNACGAGPARTLNVTVTGGASNLALNKPATASSIETPAFPAALAVDASMSTRWSSLYTSPQWIYVDLGASYNVTRVKITWEAAYGRDYQIQRATSAAGPWTTMKTITGNTTLINDHTGLSGAGRYIRMYGTASGLAGYGYSIFNFEVYGTPASGREDASEDALVFSDSPLFGLDVFPNPSSSGNITISAKILKSGHTHIDIIDLQGKTIADVHNDHLDAGAHTFSYNTEKLRTGNYIVRIMQGKTAEVRQVIKVE